MAQEKGKSARGFASMKPEDQRRIAAEGGRAAHRMGVAHEWDSREAAEAGRQGGRASHGGKGRNKSPEEKSSSLRRISTNQRAPVRFEDEQEPAIRTASQADYDVDDFEKQGRSGRRFVR